MRVPPEPLQMGEGRTTNLGGDEREPGRIGGRELPGVEHRQHPLREPDGVHRVTGSGAHPPVTAIGRSRRGLMVDDAGGEESRSWDRAVPCPTG